MRRCKLEERLLYRDAWWADDLEILDNCFQMRKRSRDALGDYGMGYLQLYVKLGPVKNLQFSACISQDMFQSSVSFVSMVIIASIVIKMLRFSKESKG